MLMHIRYIIEQLVRRFKGGAYLAILDGAV